MADIIAKLHDDVGLTQLKYQINQFEEATVTPEKYLEKYKAALAKLESDFETYVKTLAKQAEAYAGATAEQKAEWVRGEAARAYQNELSRIQFLPPSCKLWSTSWVVMPCPRLQLAPSVAVPLLLLVRERPAEESL